MSLRHRMKPSSNISKNFDRRLNLQRKIEDVMKRKSERIQGFKEELEMYVSLSEELMNDRAAESDENFEPNQDTSKVSHNRRLTLKKKFEDRIERKRRGIEK